MYNAPIAKSALSSNIKPTVKKQHILAPTSPETLLLSPVNYLLYLDQDPRELMGFWSRAVDVLVLGT